MDSAGFVNQDTSACPEEAAAIIMKEKKKCHGNRKLQHFKRKCRARGMTAEEIAGLVQAKQHTISEQASSDRPMTVNRTSQPNKRKRREPVPDMLRTAPKSTSQLSISQERPSKKGKKSTAPTAGQDGDATAPNVNGNVCKPSKYLRMPRKMLLYSLRLQLLHPVKSKTEQEFVLRRLKLLDEQFCLEQIRYLYQIHFEHGAKFHMWSVSTAHALSFHQ